MAVKGWILKGEEEVLYDASKKFESPDRRVKLEHTFGFMGIIWIVGGFACIIAIRTIASYAGLVIGALGVGLIFIINKLFTQTMSRDLHLICFAERDKKHDDFLALDIGRNEILYVQHIFRNMDDEDPKTVYYFEKVSLDFFKKYVRLRSSHYYDIIKDITPETIGSLADIQFGESKWDWVWFAKQKTEGNVILGYYRISTFGEVYAKYAEMPEEKYAEFFGADTRPRKVYEMFQEKSFDEFINENGRSFDKKLDGEEFDIVSKTFNGDQRTCKIQGDIYVCKEFISELEYSGNFGTVSANGIKLLGYLAFGSREEAFSPTVFADEEIVSEEEIKKEIYTKEIVLQEDLEERAKALTPNEKYAKFGLISMICGICSIVLFFFPVSAIPGLIFGILSIKEAKRTRTKKDKKAVAGVIMSAITGSLIALALLGMIV